VEVIIAADETAIADLAAGAIESLVRAKPDAVLGLATGSTPLPLYNELVRRATDIDFSRVRAVMLDEYLDLPIDHPESYRQFLLTNFVERIGLPPDRLVGPEISELGPEVSEAAAAYEQTLRELGGVDLQLLGIGSDGHIGFNEPTSSFGSRTRMKTLAEATRRDNARFFNGRLDRVPTHVITQGIGTILEARHVILLAVGGNKAAATAAAVEGPLTAMVPASALQLHPHATVLVDQGAARDLHLREYYEATFESKPSWQGL